MLNEANNNAACCSAQTVNAPLGEERQRSAQSVMAQAKKQSLTQPKKQAIKQQARELAVGVTRQDQHSKASGSCSVFATRSFAGTTRIASPF
jgi:hypothetical protein